MGNVDIERIKKKFKDRRRTPQNLLCELVYVEMETNEISKDNMLLLFPEIISTMKKLNDYYCYPFSDCSVELLYKLGEDVIPKIINVLDTEILDKKTYKRLIGVLLKFGIKAEAALRIIVDITTNNREFDYSLMFLEKMGNRLIPYLQDLVDYLKDINNGILRDELLDIFQYIDNGYELISADLAEILENQNEEQTFRLKIVYLREEIGELIIPTYLRILANESDNQEIRSNILHFLEKLNYHIEDLDSQILVKIVCNKEEKFDFRLRVLNLLFQCNEFSSETKNSIINLYLDSNENINIRMKIIDLLISKKLNFSKTRDLLIRDLKSNNYEMVKIVKDALLVLGEEVVDPLLEILNNSNIDEMYEIRLIEILSEINVHSIKIIQSLKRIMNEHGNSKIRIEAISSLGKIGNDYAIFELVEKYRKEYDDKTKTYLEKIISKFAKELSISFKKFINQKTKRRVFITYSWVPIKHKKWVGKLGSDLTDHNIEVLLDQHIVEGGEYPSDFILENMKNCDYILVILNDKYIEKIMKKNSFVYKEWLVIKDLIDEITKRRIIPIRRKISKTIKSKKKFNEILNLLGSEIDMSHNYDYQDKFTDLVQQIMKEIYIIK